MLHMWSVKHYRSIEDSGSLRLAPVTAFTGRNGAGKSSFLHSLMLVASLAQGQPDGAPAKSASPPGSGGENRAGLAGSRRDSQPAVDIAFELALPAPHLTGAFPLVRIACRLDPGRGLATAAPPPPFHVRALVEGGGGELPLPDEERAAAYNALATFFRQGIRYLGARRGAFSNAHPPAHDRPLGDVGAQGEAAADVYAVHRGDLVEWCHPLSGEPQWGPLEEAVNEWVRFLGLAHAVEVDVGDEGEYRWRVLPRQGQRALPLAAGGTGIAFALPVLVMGLAAPAGSVLLYECPEMGLHQASSARLGDFFLGLAACHKQCLLETQSEHIIAQLRLHVVHAGGQEKSDCLVYFVERREQGGSVFTPIEISARGNILNWPEGFCDESMRQEDRITTASLRKRARATSL